jgi:hypothetical protein
VAATSLKLCALAQTSLRADTEVSSNDGEEVKDSEISRMLVTHALHSPLQEIWKKEARRAEEKYKLLGRKRS